MKKMIYKDGRYAGCYFRSTVKKPELKVLLQITERCNLHCKHCFNSSINIGDEISYQIIEEKIIPKLVSANVTRVTLTGGEPMVHPEVIKIITAFIKKVSILRYAQMVQDFLKKLLTDYMNWEMFI